MALSARDKRIIAAIEQQVTLHDPRWALRYERRVRRLGRHEPARPSHRNRRRWSVIVALSLWVALVCADASHGPGLWLWIALAASAVALILTLIHVCVRRRRESPDIEV